MISSKSVLLEENSEQAKNFNVHEESRNNLGKNFQIVGETIVLLLEMLWIIIKSVYRVFVPRQKKSVEGEIVLITGSGHGIGKELALQYASQGAIVVCWDINKNNNDAVAKQIKKLGYKTAYAYTCNVADRNQVMETANKVRKEVGDVSILINNAGIMPTHSFLDHTVEEIERIMNINVMAHFWTLQAFLPNMIKNNHGHVVTLSSCAGLSGFKYLVPYCASKFAVRGMTEALRHELRGKHGSSIKFTTIYPYMVDTGLCKRPKIRFPKLLAMLDTPAVAEFIMDAQRRDIIETTIPGFHLKTAYLIRTYPFEIGDAIMDFTDTYVDSDL